MNMIFLSARALAGRCTLYSQTINHLKNTGVPFVQKLQNVFLDLFQPLLSLSGIKLESSPKWSSQSQNNPSSGNGNGGGGGGLGSSPLPGLDRPSSCPSPVALTTLSSTQQNALGINSSPLHYQTSAHHHHHPAPPPFSLLNHTVNNYMLPDPSKANLISQLF